MASEVADWLTGMLNLLSVYLKWFEGQSGLANFAGIIGLIPTLISLAGLVTGVAFLFSGRRVRHLKGKIIDLERDRDARDVALAKIRTHTDTLEVRCANLEARFPETVLNLAKLERQHGNAQKANSIISEWLDGEGDAVSQIFLLKAKWAIAHAVGEKRGSGFVVAEAFLNAASVSFPSGCESKEILEDIAILRRAEEQPSMQLHRALSHMQESDIMFDASEVEYSMEAEREATELEGKGIFNLAVPLIDRAILGYKRQLGDRAEPTLRARWRKCSIYSGLGKYDEVLQDIRSVIQLAMTVKHSGDIHRLVLMCRRQEAMALFGLSKYEEAFAVAEEVASTSIGVFGIADNGTILSLRLQAMALIQMQKSDRAVDLIETFLNDSLKHIEEDDPIHAAVYHLHAEALDNLERYTEALPLARNALLMCANKLGDKHPSTLAARFLNARILFHLRRYDKALSILQEVIAEQIENPAIGPYHPHHTLPARSLQAEILDEMGRHMEALKVLEDLVAIESTHLGSYHNHSITTRLLRAKVLAHVGRRADAHDIVQEMLNDFANNLGEEHVHTRRARETLAMIENT